MRKHGFTLVELLVVLAVIAMLAAAFGGSIYSSVIEKTHLTAAISSADTIAKGLQTYSLNNSKFDFASVDELKTKLKNLYADYDAVWPWDNTKTMFDMISGMYIPSDDPQSIAVWWALPKAANTVAARQKDAQTACSSVIPGFTNPSGATGNYVLYLKVSSNPNADATQRKVIGICKIGG